MNFWEQVNWATINQPEKDNEEKDTRNPNGPVQVVRGSDTTDRHTGMRQALGAQTKNRT